MSTQDSVSRAVILLNHSTIGPGVDDMTMAEYKWSNQGGGMALKPVRVNDEAWVVVGRSRDA